MSPRTLVWGPALGLALAVAPAAAQAPAGEPETAPVAFWASVADSTLHRLVAEAIESSPDVRATAARVRGARASRLGSALDFAPTVTVVGGYTRARYAAASIPGATTPSPDLDLWDAGVALSWEVDLFGRLRRSHEGQGALLASAREDLRDVQVLLAAEVAAAWFELLGVEERLAVARGNAANQQRTLELTLRRLEAGRGNSFDTERARAQLSATMAAVPALEATVAAIRHRIGVLVGRPPAELAVELPAGGRLPALPGELAVDDPDAVIGLRPDVRSAERQVAARLAFVGAARAEYLPRLSLEGSAGYTGATASSLGDDHTGRYAIGPVVSWPALNLGRVKARVDLARAGEAEAQARYEQAVLRAQEEVETAFITYRKAQERLARLEESAAASGRAAEFARRRFVEGASDFLQVLDAERTLLEAEDRLAAGRAEAAGALVGVYRAVGGAGT